MKTRLVKWVREMKDAGYTEYEIACGLTNGDIRAPKWLSYIPNTNIGFVIYDNEISDGHTQLYFLNTEDGGF